VTTPEEDSRDAAYQVRKLAMLAADEECERACDAAYEAYGGLSNAARVMFAWPSNAAYAVYLRACNAAYREHSRAIIAAHDVYSLATAPELTEDGNP